jgi:enterochelin esterase-like enzyme
MVVDELLPAIDDELDARVPRAVLGWSMGGYGALLVAETAPASFRAVVATSPALWRSYDEAAGGAFDSAADYQRFDVSTNTSVLSSLTVRVDCGTDDGFIAAARRLACILPNPNAGSFTSGFHDAGYWRSMAPTQITTIVRAMSR